MQRSIYICLSADNNYAQHMGVLICSIIKYLSPTYKAHFYVLDGGIRDENKQKIVQLQKIVRTPFWARWVGN